MFTFSKLTSVTTYDLYESFEGNISNANQPLNIKAVMDTWLRQEWYPILNVVRNYKENFVEISQTPSNKLIGKYQKWYVPLSWSDGKSNRFNDTRARAWLTPQESLLRIPVTTDSSDMILFNLQQTGRIKIYWNNSKRSGLFCKIFQVITK